MPALSRHRVSNSRRSHKKCDSIVICVEILSHLFLVNHQLISAILLNVQPHIFNTSNTSERKHNMAKRAAKRRAWTASDVRELKGLVRQHMPIAQMARALNRTEGATRQKVYGLGLKLRSRRVKSARAGSARRASH
jgi:hypothetical protein